MWMGISRVLKSRCRSLRLPGLNEKIERLQVRAITAWRVASFWRKQVELYGEVKATEFYKSKGLNHLETKSVQWEGLQLSREPTEIEKLCVKSVAQAQESSKEAIGNILGAMRTELITQGLKAIKKLDPSDYHALVLTVSKKDSSTLRSQVDEVFIRGANLVSRELAK